MHEDVWGFIGKLSLKALQDNNNFRKIKKKLIPLSPSIGSGP
jgi:hypothetical protein